MSSDAMDANGPARVRADAETFSRGRLDTAAAAPVLCIAGPTASGKTAVALAIAREVACEIVSVDSALVYRGMDIGTAKPTPAERAAVPHHLIDILDPAQSYSAARFVADATRLVDDIRRRGRVPLLVGGTMLYFKALFDGIDTLPAADPVIRAGLDAQAAREGWPALHARLAEVDPVTAARLPPGDAQRIQRALEVYQVTGKPLSQWHTRARRENTAADGGPHVADALAATASAATGAAARRWPLLSLEPADRGWLHERIRRRFDAMLEAGLVDEVRLFRARGDLHLDLPAMRCVGYRQAWEALDDATPAALDALPARGVAATRQLAKRQLTWLRGMPTRHVVAADALDAVSRAVDAALALMGHPHAGA